MNKIYFFTFDCFQLDSTENEEISDGVLVRLQSQQMLDQIHGDEPLQSSGTGPVDGDNDSSDSAEDPRQIEESEWENKLEKIRLMGRVETNTRSIKKLGDDGYQKTDTVPNGNARVYLFLIYYLDFNYYLFII